MEENKNLTLEEKIEIYNEYMESTAEWLEEKENKNN